jgi:isoquinoline 1-oxidoreductase subunit alpha
MAVIQFSLKGKPQSVNTNPEMPLLLVLRDTLGMTGTKFGCGMALCGACTVHINRAAFRSCSTKISSVAGKNVTTIEGLSSDASHPVHAAWCVRPGKPGVLPDFTWRTTIRASRTTSR